MHRGWGYGGQGDGARSHGQSRGAMASSSHGAMGVEGHGNPGAMGGVGGREERRGGAG